MILLVIVLVFATFVVKENRGGGGGGGRGGGGHSFAPSYGNYANYGGGFNSSLYDAVAWDYPSQYMNTEPSPVCNSGCRCATPYKCAGPCPKYYECAHS